MIDVQFQKRKPNVDKLMSFGFETINENYIYTTNIVDNQMRLTVTITKDGVMNTEVIDISTEDEYVLHRIESAAGAFVGRVKAEYDAILTELMENCFDHDVFKTNQAREIITYIQKQYGDELEFLWQKFPDNAVTRRKDNKKWYAAILTVSRKKLGLNSDELIEIIDLRMSPENIEAMVDNIRYFNGYHMNKKHWITICLDGSVSTTEICEMLDKSYILAGKSK